MAKWSLEWRNLVARGRCPNDDSPPWGSATTIEYVEGTGSQVRLTWIEAINYSNANRIIFNAASRLASLESIRRAYLPKVTIFREDSRFTCNQCHGVWPVFSNTGQVAILGRTNIRQTVDRLGTEDHVYDNRSSGIPMPATLKISRRWSQRLEVQWAAAKIASMAGRLSSGGAEIGRTVEQSLKTSLLMSAESEQLLEQTVDVTVPPHRRLTVLLHWKQIWQEGDLRVQLPDGTIAEIPYRATVEMPRFDQENIEG